MRQIDVRLGIQRRVALAIRCLSASTRGPRVGPVREHVETPAPDWHQPIPLSSGRPCVTTPLPVRRPSIPDRSMNAAKADGGLQAPSALSVVVVIPPALFEES